MLTYAMFPQVAPKFFEKRNNKLAGVDGDPDDFEGKSHPVETALSSAVPIWGRRCFRTFCRRPARGVAEHGGETARKLAKNGEKQ